MQTFVLGNGKSRLAVDVTKLSQYGDIYACNAAYRDFPAKVMVALDLRMAKELIRNKIHDSSEFWTNTYTEFTGKERVNMFPDGERWSSGTAAIHLATRDSPKEIFLLGFDYSGINGKINNIYAGSTNYKRVTEKATFYGNWLLQTERIIKANPRIDFIRVVDDNSLDVQWRQYRNFFPLGMDEFKSQFRV